MSNEIVRRLMENKRNPIKDMDPIFEAEEDEEDDLDLDIPFDDEESEDEEEPAPEEERPKPNRRATPHSPESYNDVPSEDEIPAEEEEAPQLDDEMNSEDKSNPNPLDNIYATKFVIGDSVNIVYTDGTSTGIEGTIDGYDAEGFYRIRLRDGFTISGLTDIAISDLIEDKNTNEGKCICGSGSEYFITEGNSIVCDRCGRKIKEYKDPLMLLDQGRGKNKKMIRSTPAPMSTATKPNIADAIGESNEFDDEDEEELDM